MPPLLKTSNNFSKSLLLKKKRKKEKKKSTPSIYFNPHQSIYEHSLIDYSHIVLIIAIWLGDRIRRPKHSTVEHGSCDESV